MWHDSVSLSLYTDSAASFGYGALFGFELCYGAWPNNWKTFKITILEFYPIVLSVLLWGDQMRNKHITFFTDNAALLDIINKSTFCDVTVMVFVRRLVLACLQFNILFHPQHVAVGVRPTPTVIPSHLLPLYSPLLPCRELQLIQSSLQPSSIPTYRRARKLCSEFLSAVFQSASVNLPISPPFFTFDGQACSNTQTIY